MVGVFSHTNRIQNPKVSDLIVTDSIHKLKWIFLLVRFDASDKMQIGVSRHLDDQLRNLSPNFESQELFGWLLLHFILETFEQRIDDWRRRCGELLNNIIPHEIFIFHPKSFHHVLDVSGSMADNEALFESRVISGWEVFMSLVVFFYIGQEINVTNIERAALV